MKKRIKKARIEYKIAQDRDIAEYLNQLKTQRTMFLFFAIIEFLYIVLG